MYELIMGLETHVRVNSKTKMFCGCKNAVELEGDPNINTCTFCMGFPGALPVLNEEVVNLATKAGLAMKCTINNVSVFDRKSYFYPDLPTGYQITQLYYPIAEHGTVEAYVNGELKSFKIHRMHIECDAGKLVHAGNKTLCDYNRSGSPLMEIVTEPDFRTKEDVIEYLTELQKIMRFVGASNADMEKGQLRCDVNISLRLKGETTLRNRVEIKNLNSFSAIARAIDTEFKRQVKIYESGGTIDQETRGWDDEKGVSNSLRSKEDAMDYRYFPEPDLKPLVLTDEYIAERVIKELPIDRRKKYLEEYKLLDDDARILSNDRTLGDIFEGIIIRTKDPKKACSFITTVLFAILKESLRDVQWWSVDEMVYTISHIINLLNKDELSSTSGKQVFEEYYKIMEEELEKTRNHNVLNEKDTIDFIEKIIDRLGLRQKNDTEALAKIVDEVLANSSSQIEQYKSGKVNLFGYFVGECMKASKGQGNPKIFSELIKNKIG
ncbi:MAG: Asp-tRNA(Asn)/Glu-tRNA(Gln) amidotransferase subunit GatB [Candidatus Gracilibacteria bacterium]|nr:Asp-tRNA(Asn)/Glu-tRNA(Gln) amidotransferase subunit GatB [Candidatus Gracilibacteria bacterium]